MRRQIYSMYLKLYPNVCFKSLQNFYELEMCTLIVFFFFFEGGHEFLVETYL